MALFESLLKTDISLIFPILGSHIKRIGLLRTTAGGLSMYLCIPILVLLHLSFVVIFYQWLLRPLFGTTRLQWKDYVILDRHRIQGLCFVDRVNCLFCGYANGLCTLINKELDQLQSLDAEMGIAKRGLLVSIMLIMLPIGLIFELSFQLIYNIFVSRPLGMHRVSIKETSHLLTQQHYASQFPMPIRLPILSAKSTFLRFAMALEQIESSWCPLRHFERREGVVYPEHHKHFFGPDEIAAMREVLLSEGTVSARKPIW